MKQYFGTKHPCKKNAVALGSVSVISHTNVIANMANCAHCIQPIKIC